MVWNNQDFHGQMARNTSLNVQFNRVLISAKRLYFRQRKELFGGTLIAIGHEQPYTVLLLSIPSTGLATLSPCLSKKCSYN